MELNGLPVPLALERALLSGSATLTPGEHRALTRLVGAADGDRWVALCDLEWIARENVPWGDPEISEAYQGLPAEIDGPGDIDFRRSICIGFAGSDEPIALAFRIDPPRVIYLCQVGPTHWRVLAPSYQALRSMLSSEAMEDR